MGGLLRERFSICEISENPCFSYTLIGAIKILKLSGSESPSEAKVYGLEHCFFLDAFQGNIFLFALNLQNYLHLVNYISHLKFISPK